MDSRVSTARSGRREDLQNVSNDITSINRDIIINANNLRSQLTNDSYLHNQKLLLISQELNRSQHAKSQQVVFRLKMQENLQKLMHKSRQEILQAISKYRLDAKQKSEKLRAEKARIKTAINTKTTLIESKLNDTAEISRYIEKQEKGIEEILESVKLDIPFREFITI